MKKPTGRHFGVFGTLSRGPCEARCAAPEASGGAFAWPVPLCTRRRGPAVLLGNSRYYLEEEGKGKGNEGNKTHAGPTKVKAFRESMAKLAVTYCSDAFGTAHTAHGSMVGEGYPIKCPAYLLTKEPDFSAKVIGTPTRPVSGILGGATVTSMIPLTMNLLDMVNILIIGGGMAFPFIEEAGEEAGSSLYDEEGAALVPEIKDKAAERGVELNLPVD